MASSIRLFIFIIIGICLSSCCQNLYYVNDPVVLGNVTKKEDFNVAAGLNIGTLTGGLHAHSSYAISDKFFLAGSFSRYSGGCTSTSTVNGVTTDNSIKYSGNSFLLSGGYYRHLGGNFYFEGSGGIKYGNNMNKKAGENFEYRHLKYCLQPAITYTMPHFQTGLGLRMGIIDYLPYRTGSQRIIPDVARQSPLPYIDPSLYLCGGGEKVKLGLQVSSAFTDNSTIAYNPLGVVLGLASSDPLSLSLFLKLTIPSKKN